MDGGRVLRALLAFNMNKLRATTIAARIGQFLAIVFVFLGFFTNFWLVFIGLFIYLGAGAEAVQESTKSMLIGYAARDVLIQQHIPLLPSETLEMAMKLFQNTLEQGFIVTENGRVQGILTRKELIKGLSEYRKSSPVSNVMRKDYIILSPDMPLQEVYQKLLANNFSLAPVLEDGQLIGIVDIKGINELITVKKALKSQKFS
jgi:predicted transcriptional regulator